MTKQQRVDMSQPEQETTVFHVKLGVGCKSCDLFQTPTTECTMLVCFCTESHLVLWGLHEEHQVTMEMRIARQDCKQFVVTRKSATAPIVAVALSAKNLALALANTRQMHSECDVVLELTASASGHQGLTVMFVRECDSKQLQSTRVSLEPEQVCSALVQHMQPLNSAGPPSASASASVLLAAHVLRQTVYRVCLAGMREVSGQPVGFTRPHHHQRYTCQVTMRLVDLPDASQEWELASQGECGSCVLNMLVGSSSTSPLEGNKSAKKSSRSKTAAAAARVESKQVAPLVRSSSSSGVFAGNVLVQLAESSRMASSVQLSIVSSPGQDAWTWSWTLPVLQHSHLRWFIKPTMAAQQESLDT